MIVAPAGRRQYPQRLRRVYRRHQSARRGVLWKAGEHSLIDDVRFLGGHGSGTQPLQQQPHRRSRSAQALGRAVSQPLDRRRRRRHVRRHLDAQHLRAGRLHGLQYQHARPRLRALRTSITCATKSSSTTSRTGTSTRRRPKKKPAKAPSRFRWKSTPRRTSPFANYHGYRVTRSRAPFPAAVRMYNSSDIHFRNVHVNAESGYGICDENGCGTFLRVSKFPYENAIQDVTHHLEVREREFAVLDIPGQPAQPARQRRCRGCSRARSKVEKLEDGFFSISGAAVDAAGKLYFVDHHEQRIYALVRAGGPHHRARQPARSRQSRLRQIRQPDRALFRRAEGTVYTFKPGTLRRKTHRARSRSPRSRTPAPQPSCLSTAGTTANSKTSSISRRCASRRWRRCSRRDVTTPKTREYVSPDGSVFLPAGRVFQQGPATDYLRLALQRQSRHLWLPQRQTRPARLRQQRVRGHHLQRAWSNADGTLSRSQALRRSAAARVSPSIATAMSMSPTARSSSTRPRASRSREIDVPERPAATRLRRRRSPHALHPRHHALYAVKVRAAAR